jgi:hypothetical protein
VTLFTRWLGAPRSFVEEVQQEDDVVLRLLKSIELLG